MSLPRRRFLGWLGAAGVGAAAGTAAGMRLAESSPAPTSAAGVDPVVPFHGPHQAGITTPRQPHLVFAALDVVPPATRDDLAALLRYWTGAAARMTEGQLAAPPSADPQDAPWDTGEALGLGPSRLTLTFGVGPTMFGVADDAGGRLIRPDGLVELPAFDTDELDPARSGGDLCIQACADDEQVAFHAIRELVRLGHGIVSVRWLQAGFLPRVAEGETPRNLMGFRDGTRNIAGDDDEVLDRFVWVGPEGPPWLRGGTFLVARRIDIRIDAWDATSLELQEAVIGRGKVTGAPPNATNEHDPLDLAAVDTEGIPLVAPNAHVRVTAPESNGDQQLLRRSYSFLDHSEDGLRAGLLFLAFQRDPRRQFVPIQRRLARTDALNRYTRHTGSALFAVFPGVPIDGVLGGDLFSG